MYVSIQNVKLFIESHIILININNQPDIEEQLINQISKELKD